MRVVYWTCTAKHKKAIMKWFGLQGTTINGETDADNISPEQEEKFLEGAKQGFYQIRNK